MARANVIDGGLGSRCLATSRLSLRWIAAEDAGFLAQYGSDPVILQKTETIPYPHDEATARDWIAQSDALRQKGEAYRFAVTDRAAGTFLGVCAFELVRDCEGVAELGYWLGRPFWDKGYGREAVAALIAFGRDILALRIVQAIVYAENTASVAVLQGQGFAGNDYELFNVPERGGKRLVRRFTLELNKDTAADGGALLVAAQSQVQVA